jgi:hypothetical protein
MNWSTVALASLILTAACNDDSTSRHVGPDGGALPIPDGGVLPVGNEAGVQSNPDAGDAGRAKRRHTFEWVKSLNNSDATNSAVAAMAADATGAVIAGQLEGTATAGTTMLSAADQDPLLVKYDTEGNVKWSLMPDPGAGASDARFTAVAIDASGNTYVAGIYLDTLAVGGVALAHDDANGFGSPAVLAKIGPDGSVAWAKTLQATDEVIPTGLAFTAAGDVLVTGSMQGDAKFDAAGTVTASVPYPGGIFLADFKSNGAAVWAQVVASMPDAVSDSDRDQGASIATDTKGNAYLAAAKHTDAGDGTVIVDKLALGAAAPTLTWSVTATGSGGEATEVNAIAVDSNGDLVVVGDTGDSPLAFNASVTAPSDRFIAKFTAAAGTVSWASTYNAGAVALAVDGTDSYVFGNASVDVGDNEGMGLFKFDETGTLRATVGCGAQANLGQGVAAVSGTVYVAGTITAPGSFGTLDESQSGMFTAKLVSPVTGAGRDD